MKKPDFQFAFFRIALAVLFLFSVLPGTHGWIMGLSAFFGLGLLWGYQASFFAFFCWVLSLAAIDSLTFYAGDRILQILLFFTCVFSLNLKGFKNLSIQKFYTFQIFVIYFFAGLFKLLDVSWQTGRGVYYAFSSAYSYPWVEGFTQNQTLMVALNHMTLMIEFVIPFLLFFNANRYPRLRISVLGLLVFFHLSITATLNLPIFQLLMIAALIPLWPQKTEILSPPHPRVLLSQMLCAVYLFFGIIFNLQAVYTKVFPLKEDQPSFFSALNLHFLRTFGFYQYWGVFSSPILEDKRLSIYLTSREGKKTEWVQFGEREQQRRNSLMLKQNEAKRADYARTLCSKNTQIIEMIEMKRNIFKDGGKSPAQISVLLTYSCEPQSLNSDKARSL